MVKPPRNMEPEAVDLKKAGRAAGKAFQEDSFRNYMSRKIDMQRKQFGLILPPPPEAVSEVQREDDASQQSRCHHGVHFADDVVDQSTLSTNEKKKRRSVLHRVLKRLKRRHGRLQGKRKSEQSPGEQDREVPVDGSGGDDSRCNASELIDADSHVKSPVHDFPLHAPDTKEDSPTMFQCGSARPTHRPDLFFTGICVLVDGYTNPDTDTLQRLLHKHGGDLERYETSKVTHVIAEHLSNAKASIYKGRRRPTPVCYPAWIVDSVTAKKLLPHADYLIQEVRGINLTSMTSAASFFCNTAFPVRPVKGTNGTNLVGTLLHSGRDAEKIGFAKFSGVSTFTEISMAGEEKHSSVGEQADDLKAERHAVPVAVRSPGRTPKKQVPDEQYPKRQRSNETDGRCTFGHVRTVGTDPDFLESFFAASRLSFIGSYKQRTKQSPAKKVARGSKNSRFVFHVDMDCFFASVVLRNYPEYQDKPVAISHHGKSPEAPPTSYTKDSTSECATCNYHARKFGITKGMYLGRAKELCPSLIVLQYDFDGYEEVSEQVTEILSNHADKYGGNMEQVSCDEAYLELFIDWDIEENARPAKVFDIAESIRAEIFESTRCTATIGVASNKFLAKLAGDRVKPNRSFVVEDYRGLLSDLKLRDLHGIGYRLDKKLAEEGLVNVLDVWALGNEAESELCRILGPGVGRRIYLFCCGIDNRRLEPAERKTIGAECNYGVRFNGPYGVEHMITGLAKEVETRMSHVGVCGTKVTLKLKQRKPGAPPPPKFLGHGSCHNLSKSCDTPNGAATRDHAIISKACMEMFAKMAVNLSDIRGIGIVMSKLAAKDKVVQGKNSNGSIQTLFSAFTTATPRTMPFQLPDVNASRQCEQTDTPVTTSKNDAPASPSVIVLDTWDRVTSSSDHEVAGVTASRDFDIALPSASQIHMSQVQELPSPMRRSIISKMDQHSKEDRRGSDVVQQFGPGDTTRFRQTDMRRMMRLAAFKSGQQNLSAFGEPIFSLTQFERLPLEMQLQVANGDDRPVGRLSKHRKNVAVSGSKRVRNHIDLVHQRKVQTGPEKLSRPVLLPAEDGDTHLLYDDDEKSSSPSSFFLENVKPLSVFLDENDFCNDEAVGCVIQFFEVCTNENRLFDIVILLRSIKNRSDGWSRVAFETIFDAVNSKVEALLGGWLDKEWIVSTTNHSPATKYM